MNNIYDSSSMFFVLPPSGASNKKLKARRDELAARVGALTANRDALIEESNLLAEMARLEKQAENLRTEIKMLEGAKR